MNSAIEHDADQLLHFTWRRDPVDGSLLLVPREDLAKIRLESVGLRHQLDGVAKALHEAIQLARDFNRGAMTWQEYDRKLADLELAYPKDT